MPEADWEFRCVSASLQLHSTRGEAGIQGHTTILSAACAAALWLAAAAADGTGPVASENARAGTPGWQLPAASAGAIEGYTSQLSALRREAISFHVSTRPVQGYRILVYRLRRGAGGGGPPPARPPTAPVPSRARPRGRARRAGSCRPPPPARSRATRPS